MNTLLPGNLSLLPLEMAYKLNQRSPDYFFSFMELTYMFLEFFTRPEITFPELFL